MRFTTICFLILIVLFVGHSLYDRTMTDRKLAQAIGMLPGDPMGSYHVMKDALDYNRFIALGKVGDAEEKYLRALEQKMVGELKDTVPPPEAYQQAERTLNALNELSKQTGVDVKKARVAVVQAARDSVPTLKEKGSLNAWDNMIIFFRTISANTPLIAESLPNFKTWYEELTAVPRPPFGLRDATRQASQLMTQALAQIKLPVSTNPEIAVAAAPPALGDEQLITADKAFQQAQNAITNYQNLFGETKTPTELNGLRAKIFYNMAAIKLAHFQDHKDSLPRTGSDYIAEFLIRSDTSYVPTASEMVSQWQLESQREFDEAKKYFDQATTLDESMRKAYAALSIWASGTVQVVFAHAGLSPEIQTRALDAAAGVTGPAATMIQTMKTTPRALLIVQIP